MRRAGLVVACGRRQQVRLFGLPLLRHRLVGAPHPARGVFQARLPQVGVQLGKGADLEHGREEIALVEPHVALDAAFLMALGRCAIVAIKQIMAAKAREGLLFAPIMAFEHLEHSRFQVVIGNPLRHTPEKPKGLDMTLEESLLLLERKGHHKPRMRVIQTHGKELDRHPLTRQLDHGLTPVRLGILPRIELQRQKGGPGLARPPLLADVATHRDFAARIAVLWELFIDRVGRIPLLARLLITLVQQLLDAGLVRTQHRRWAHCWLGVGFWLGLAQRFPHHDAAVMKPLRNLAYALLFQKIRPTHRFVVFHLEHLLTSVTIHNFPYGNRETAQVGSFSISTFQPGGLVLQYH